MKLGTSVVIPTYNGYRWREEIKQSLLGNLDNIAELIFINDGEQEDFERLIKDVSGAVQLPICCLRTSGRAGAAAARNLGLDHAGAEYIAFLDCDDLWWPGSLAARLNVLEQHPDAVFAYSSVRFVNENGTSISSYQVPIRAARETLLVTNYISTPTVVIRADRLAARRFRAVGHEDYDLWLSLLDGAGKYAAGLQKCSVDIRLVAGSLSHNKRRAANWHYEILKSNGIPHALRALLFAGYALNGVLKKKLGFTRPLFCGLQYLARHY